MEDNKDLTHIDTNNQQIENGQKSIQNNPPKQSFKQRIGGAVNKFGGKALPLTLFGGLLYGAYKMFGGGDNQTQQTNNIQQPIQQPKQPTTQQTIKQNKPNTTLQNNNNNILDFSEIHQLEQERLKYIEAMNKIQSELQNEIANYSNVVKELNNKTATISNAVLVFLAKQGLGNYIDNDFVEHIQNTITYTPAQVLPMALQKVVKGYLTTKALGVDTSGLSYIHLTELADNPNYAKVLEPNFMAGIDVISKTLTNQYTNYLNELKMKQEQQKMNLEIAARTADIIGNVIKDKLTEHSLLLNYYNANLDYKAKMAQIAASERIANMRAASKQDEGGGTGSIYTAEAINRLNKQAEELKLKGGK